MLLALVLIPFIGKGVNGARRWISFGVMNFQPSELAKFATIIYAADYMVRKMDVKERFFRAVLPMGAAVALAGVFLLAEPDMGAFMVIAIIAMGILFLGGVNARMFFLIFAVLVGAFVAMIAASPWRRDRIFAYLDPFSAEHALGKGYQLSHSLIAIGRGEVVLAGDGGLDVGRRDARALGGAGRDDGGFQVVIRGGHASSLSFLNAMCVAWTVARNR